MESKKKQYYGSKEVIESFPNIEGHTIVTFADGAKLLLHKDIVKNVLTPEPQPDLTELRRLRVAPAVKKMLEVCLEYNLHPFLPMEEVKFAADMVNMSFKMNVDNAEEKLWKKHLEDITTQDVQDVLKNE